MSYLSDFIQKVPLWIYFMSLLYIKYKKNIIKYNQINCLIGKFMESHFNMRYQSFANIEFIIQVCTN